MSPLAVEIPVDQLADFCRRWKICELALFGSVLSDRFGPVSDVDVLVTFEDGADWSLLDVIAAEQELAELFGRSVDLVERRTVEQSENWIRRDAILNTARTVYAG